MKTFFMNTALFIASLFISSFIYAVLLWGLDKLSESLQRPNILETVLFWLSHLGFGFVLYPLLIFVMFYFLKVHILVKYF